MSDQSYSSPVVIDSWTAEMGELTTRKITEWRNILVKLGLPEEQQMEWKTIFKSEVEGLYGAMIQDALRHQNNVCTEIEDLLQRSEELCKQLRIKMPEHGADKLSLYEEKRLLKEKVQEYQLEVENVLKEVADLNKKKSKLCKSLGRPYQPLRENPIPTQAELEDVRNTIDTYSDEYFLRTERFCSTKSKILDLINELEYEPSLNFERSVTDPDESKFDFTDSNMSELQKLYESLNAQLQILKEEESVLRRDIEDLWERLAEDVKYRNDFLQNLSGSAVSIVRVLRSEFKRCEDLKKTNIAKFVQNLRDELMVWWQKCHFTDEQQHFEFFYSDIYTEDLLTLHTMEVDKLKKYHSENSELFTLIAKREELWGKLLKLEDRVNTPCRYKNRGAQLLKEEKERNALSKSIAEVEKRLRQLSDEYKHKNGGESFTTWGETVETIIERDHELRKNDHKLKLSAKKSQRDRTPGKPVPQLTPCSSDKKLTTPSENKRKQCTPLVFQSKRGRILQEHDEIVPRTAPPKIILTGPTPKASRLSIERGKRIKKCIRWSKGKGQNENDNLIAAFSYETFENGMTNKDAQRSTIYMEAGSSATMAVPLAVTPARHGSTPKTPKTTPGMGQNENDNLNAAFSYETFENGMTNKDPQRSTIYVEAGSSATMDVPLAVTPARRGSTPKTPKTTPGKLSLKLLF